MMGKKWSPVVGVYGEIVGTQKLGGQGDCLVDSVYVVGVYGKIVTPKCRKTFFHFFVSAIILWVFMTDNTFRPC